jgi:serine/threonine-protein kinase RsbW
MRVLAEVTVPARLENLEGLIQWVLKSAAHCGLAGEALFVVELVTEEAIVNVFSYAYPEREGDVRLRCMEDGDRFVIEVIDWGIPFDVTILPDPDVTKPLEERPVGGLGVYFMRKMTDEMRYRRDEGRNVLTLFLIKEGSAG